MSEEQTDKGILDKTSEVLDKTGQIIDKAAEKAKQAGTVLALGAALFGASSAFLSDIPPQQAEAGAKIFKTTAMVWEDGRSGRPTIARTSNSRQQHHIQQDTGFNNSIDNPQLRHTKSNDRYNKPALMGHNVEFAGEEVRININGMHVTESGFFVPSLKRDKNLATLHLESRDQESLYAIHKASMFNGDINKKVENKVGYYNGAMVAAESIRDRNIAESLYNDASEKKSGAIHAYDNQIRNITVTSTIFEPHGGTKVASGIKPLFANADNMDDYMQKAENLDNMSNTQLLFLHNASYMTFKQTKDFSNAKRDLAAGLMLITSEMKERPKISGLGAHAQADASSFLQKQEPTNIYSGPAVNNTSMNSLSDDDLTMIGQSAAPQTSTGMDYIHVPKDQAQIADLQKVLKSMSNNDVQKQLDANFTHLEKGVNGFIKNGQPDKNLYTMALRATKLMTMETMMRNLDKAADNTEQFNKHLASYKNMNKQQNNVASR